MTLLGLFEEHRAEWEYEWRTRFRVPLSRVGGRRMSWGEAFRLGMLLLGDPATQVGAAHAGLVQPVTPEYRALQLILSNQHAKDTKRRATVRTLPDPFEARPRRLGAGSGRTIDHFEAAVAAHRGVVLNG